MIIIQVKYKTLFWKSDREPLDKLCKDLFSNTANV